MIFFSHLVSVTYDLKCKIVINSVTSNFEVCFALGLLSHVKNTSCSFTSTPLVLVFLNRVWKASSLSWQSFTFIKTEVIIVEVEIVETVVLWMSCIRTLKSIMLFLTLRFSENKTNHGFYHSTLSESKIPLKEENLIRYREKQISQDWGDHF